MSHGNGNGEITPEQARKILGDRREVLGEEWETEVDPPYVWHIEASDKQGHSAVIKFRVPTNLPGEAAEIVAQRWNPLTTNAQVYRHAAMIGMTQLMAMADDPIVRAEGERTARQWEMDARRAALRRELERNQRVKHEYEDTLQLAVQAQDWRLLGQTLDTLRESAQDEAEPLRTHLYDLADRFERQRPRP